MFTPKQTGSSFKFEAIGERVKDFSFVGFFGQISSHQVWKISQAEHVMHESSASFKEVPDECHET